MHTLKKLFLGRPNFIFGAAVISVLIVTGNYQSEFSLLSTGGNTTGLTLAFYHLSRILFMICISAACISCGYWFLRIINIKTIHNTQGFPELLIPCFFSGATLFSIIAIVLGFAGLINKTFSYLLFLPFLTFSFIPLSCLFNGLNAGCNKEINKLQNSNLFNKFILFPFLIVSFLLFLVSRVLFIPVPDWNIWEHYLQYYQKVNELGSIMPNDLWHHFFNTKGSGLSFLCVSLADVFSVQLVSGIFVTMTGIILFALLYKNLKSLSLGLFGTIIFFLYFYGDARDGALFRVHAVIMGYISFMLWCVCHLQSQDDAILKNAAYVSVISTTIYLGFYQPIITCILFMTAGLMIFINTKWHCYINTKDLILIIGLASFGTILVFLINYLITGIYEITPMSFFWTLANKEKAKNIFGIGGIEFFLNTKNDVEGSKNRLLFLIESIRMPVDKLFLYSSVLFTVFYTLKKIFQNTRREINCETKLISYTLCFVISNWVLFIIFNSQSINRLSVYTVFLNIILVTFTLKEILLVPGIAKANNYLNLVLNIKNKQIQNIFSPTNLIILLFIVSSLILSRQHIKGLSTIVFNFAACENSLLKTMMMVEQKECASSGLNLNVLLDINNKIKPKGEFFALTYEPGFCYFLPNGCVVSEPSYSFHRSITEIQNLSPEDIEKLLKEKNIEFLSIDLAKHLFSRFAFSALFDRNQADKYLNCVYQNGSLFIFSFRNKSDNSNKIKIPSTFFDFLEVKKSSILGFPFSREFENILKSRLIESNIISFGKSVLCDQNSESYNSSELLFNNNQMDKIKSIVSDILANEIIHNSSLTGNSAKIPKMLFKMSLTSHVGDSFSNLETNNLSFIKFFSKTKNFSLREFLINLRSQLAVDYISMYGQEFAFLEILKNESFPFGMTYKRYSLPFAFEPEFKY